MIKVNVNNRVVMYFKDKHLEVIKNLLKEYDLSIQGPNNYLSEMEIYVENIKEEDLDKLWKVFKK